MPSYFWPSPRHVDQILSDFTFGKEHLEDIVPVEDPVLGGENVLQLLCLKTRCNPWPRPGYPGHQQRIVRCTKYRVASFGPDNSRQGRPEHALATKTTIRGENMEVGIES